MDENSCEDETSKSVENAAEGQKAKKTPSSPELEGVGVRIAVGKANQNDVSNRCGSSYDASGPSADFRSSDILKSRNSKTTDLMPINKPAESMEPSAPSEENESVGAVFSASVEEREIELVQALAPVQENCLLPSYEDGQDIHSRVRIVSNLNEQLTVGKTSIGPPPSYSFVMKQKKKLKPVPSPEPLVINRPPPPTYAGTRGLILTPEENRLDRICNLPSFVEPVWRSHSQPALCPRCGVIVLTTTHSHDSVATHVAALALCLFGCWPCCLLPYCMNICKNTYHHCPICQAYLGLYMPW